MRLLWLLLLLLLHCPPRLRVGLIGAHQHDQCEEGEGDEHEDVSAAEVHGRYTGGCMHGRHMGIHGRCMGGAREREGDARRCMEIACMHACSRDDVGADVGDRRAVCNWPLAKRRGGIVAEDGLGVDL